MPFWPAGTYTMVVDSAAPGITGGGKSKISLTLLSKSGPSTGHRYVWDLVFDPDNPRYFLERLHTLGVGPEFLATNPSLTDISACTVSPARYQVTIRNAEFNGRPTTRISKLERA